MKSLSNTNRMSKLFRKKFCWKKRYFNKWNKKKKKLCLKKKMNNHKLRSEIKRRRKINKLKKNKKVTHKKKNLSHNLKKCNRSKNKRLLPSQYPKKIVKVTIKMLLWILYSTIATKKSQARICQNKQTSLKFPSKNQRRKSKLLNQR